MIGDFAGRNCGTPLALNPSSTCGSLSAGSIAGTGASSESLPCSTSCKAATEVIALTIEAMRKTVSRVIAGPPGSRRWPKIPS